MGWKQLKTQKSILPAFSPFEVLTFRSDKEGLKTSNSLKVYYPHLLYSSNLQPGWGWRRHCMCCINLYAKVVLGGQRRTLIFSSDVAAQFSCILSSCIFIGMNGVIVTSTLMLYEIIIFSKFLLVSGIKLYCLLPKAILLTDPMDQMIQHECPLHWNSFNHHCFS
ncbi:hypothetical protein Cgig2_014371 [Carnegiea gigantea]|uniref:Uncharacterized protein n=1 Tax=Carnegiea gigantea TaxID=171969 RepID=A0A9Q1KFM4_9CARY|nr:hypothetical protein Cgig2_014371 [Carnegiea gigantea]